MGEARSDQEEFEEALELFVGAPELFTSEALSGPLNDEFIDVYNSIVTGGPKHSLALLAAVDLSRCDRATLGYLAVALVEPMFDLYGDEHLDALMAAVDRADPSGSVRSSIWANELGAEANAKFVAWAKAKGSPG